MNTLRTFYVRSLIALAVTLALAAYAVPTSLIPVIESKLGDGNWLAASLSFLMQRWVFVVVLLAGEYFIRKKLWKIFHPELNFAGTWEGYTEYTTARIGKSPVPFRTKQTVILEQDCLKLRLKPSKGENFRFKSRAIDIQDGGNVLVYAYFVKYKPGTPDRPTEAYGFEELEVVGYSEKGVPSELEGWFAHCARNEIPVFEGTVSLSRPGNDQKIRPVETD